MRAIDQQCRYSPDCAERDRFGEQNSRISRKARHPSCLRRTRLSPFRRWLVRRRRQSLVDSTRHTERADCLATTRVDGAAPPSAPIAQAVFRRFQAKCGRPHVEDDAIAKADEMIVDEHPHKRPFRRIHQSREAISRSTNGVDSLLSIGACNCRRTSSTAGGRA